ncbi:MAG TPA: DUF5995 family protein [Solirubrobacteraceae bacterium]|jgi:hypothetical protein|nr:DUF5995 family protein [Solirubrobacteraceae bacterium]
MSAAGEQTEASRAHAPAAEELDGFTPAETIDEVIERMTEIGASLEPRDGVGYFNRMYLAVTQSVKKGLQDAGFESGPFMSRLDVVFANRYLKAVVEHEAGKYAGLSWRPLFHARMERRAPVQFAICGMNAHINHDLPLSIVDTAQEMGVEPAKGTPECRDFEHVNEVLRQVEAEVKSEFVTGLLAEIDRVMHGAGDKLAMWSIADARWRAWEHAEFLWRLRDHKELTKLYRDVLSQVVDVGGQGILI